MPDNDVGKPTNVTNKTLETAAKAEGQSVEEAQKNALGEKPSRLERSHGFDKYVDR